MENYPPTPVLAYATSSAYQNAGIWREGNLLVTRKGFPLPPTCVKCNSADNTRIYRKTLQWHHPGIYVIVLFNVIVYAIVAMIVRKSARVEFCLCEAHRKSRNKRILITWLLVLAGLGTLFYGIYDATTSRSSDDVVGPVCISLGILLVLVGAIFGIYAVRVLYPKKIDANFVWIAGAGAAYVNAVAPPSI